MEAVDLLERLEAWARSVGWCRWLEVGGSLGRGAGDELSDLDAGIGVDLEVIEYADARDATLAAVRAFAPVAADLVQAWGSETEPADHLIVQYRHGCQLSLVVLAADARKGLPPGSRAALDRDGRLAEAWLPDSFAATPATRREWAFLAWVALGDAARHLRRGRAWRAIVSLQEARDLLWRLHASGLEVDYPSFGAISVENAGLPAPKGIAETLPGEPSPEAILEAARALADLLGPSGVELNVSGIEQATRESLDAATRSLQPSSGGASYRHRHC